MGRSMSDMRKDGKPMRALRALERSTPANPLTEYDVFRACQVLGGWTPLAWHGALATLVKRSLAERCGVRGGYQWFITDAGRELLHDTFGESA